MLSFHIQVFTQPVLIQSYPAARSIVPSTAFEDLQSNIFKEYRGLAASLRKSGSNILDSGTLLACVAYCIYKFLYLRAAGLERPLPRVNTSTISNALCSVLIT